MIKIGIIGNVATMQHYVQTLRKETGFEIVGKSSIGLIDQPAASLLSVPEYTKTELVSVTDAIIVDKASMVTFTILKDAVRNYKHLFLADFPEITPAQCIELNKLVQEAGNVVMVRNPLQEESASRWISENWQEPAYLNYFEGYNQQATKRTLLIKILLYAYSLFGTNPQKIRVSGVTSQNGPGSFLNIRLDYSTFSALNLEILEQPENEIRIKAALPGKFIESSGLHQFSVNHHKISVETTGKTGFVRFIEHIRLQQSVSGNGLNTLYQVLETYDELIRKIRLYSNWPI
jgi:hypothetical protein